MVAKIEEKQQAAKVSDQLQFKYWKKYATQPWGKRRRLPRKEAKSKKNKQA